MHYISVLNEVVFSFDAEFTGCAALRFSAQSYEILVFNDLRADESAFEIRMDNSGTLRCFHAITECPCAYFVRSRSEERTEFQEGIRGFDKSVHAGLFQPDLLEEHLTLLVTL